MSIQERVNSNLELLFNTDDDPIYQRLICDADGTVPSGTITDPTDIDIGVLASQIEYLRILSYTLIDQIYVDTATGDILKYQLEEFFNIYRDSGETESAWVTRMIEYIIYPKVSRAAIIYFMRPFSDEEPIVSTGAGGDAAFADYSFANIYVNDEYVLDGRTIYIMPAIAESYGSGLYRILITLFETDSDDFYKVSVLLNRIIAAGTNYVLTVVYA